MAVIYGTYFNDNNTYNGYPYIWPFNYKPSLKGTDNDDWIDALDGNDYVLANGGHDTVYGGRGNESL